MGIIKLALTRPYTFIVLAILILIAAPVVILGTPTDIFPAINIPVVSIAWNYTGLNAEELEGRLTTPYEKTLTTLVDNIQHIESTTVAGQVVVKVYLQPGASLDTANSQVSSASQFILRNFPPGTLPPQIINFSASSVPILQLGLSGNGLSEQQLNDYGLNFIRPALVTVAGAVVPNVYGGKQRSIMINLDPKALQAKGMGPQDVLTAMAQQNVVQPAGTAKIGSDEYDIHLNSSPLTIKALNDGDQVLFRYCDAHGRLREEANPNGSVESIAGVCNAGRNVFGMMPHPERAADERLDNTDGKALFASLLSSVMA